MRDFRSAREHHTATLHNARLDTPPDAKQTSNLAHRTQRGPLTPAEAARLIAGVERLIAERDAVRALHTLMLRGGLEICRECSGWDGRRYRGALTPWPCPTVRAAEVPR